VRISVFGQFLGRDAAPRRPVGAARRPYQELICAAAGGNPEKSLDTRLQTGYRHAMNAANRSLRRRKVNLRSDSFSLSNAKTHLGRLVEKASKGQTVYIMRGERRFMLQEVSPIDPIPIRPAGYFANCYGKEEIQEQNRLAKASVVRF
jgi:hypothetical protein